MKKCVVIAVFIVLLLGVVVGLRSASQHQASPEVCFQRGCFRVEVVSSIQNQAQGLMFRSHLPVDAGMLFIFDRLGYHGIWMKNMQIPLDVLWINSQKKVVFIQDHVLPCRTSTCPVYKSTVDSRYVLEVNAGRVKQLQIQEGDVVHFSRVSLASSPT